MDDSDRSSKFALMISGMTASTVSLTASLTASNLSSSLTTATTNMQRQTKSNFFLHRRSSTGSSTGTHGRRRRSRRMDSNFSTYDHAPVLTTNLAPRRPSVDNPIALFIGEKQAQRSKFALTTNLAPRRPSADNPIALFIGEKQAQRSKFGRVDFDPPCTKSSEDNKIQFGQVDLGTKCVTATSKDNNAIPERIECSKEEALPTVVTRKIDDGRTANAGKLIQHMLNSDKDGWCQWSNHHNDDDDCSTCSSIHSHHDCGWLPWPDNADDDGGGTATQSIIDNSISSNYSKDEENSSFFPWPDTTSI